MLDNSESYCERCGSRYLFRPNAPRTLSLKGARVLAKGLKNFVLNDGQSMNDSIALARNEDEHEDTSRMTEAFHRTFNFCMTCRQYACAKCWNARQGACLTCAPDPGLEPVAPEDHLIVRTPVARRGNDWALFPQILESDGKPVVDTPSAPEAWPTQDLEVLPRGTVAGGSRKSDPDPAVREPADREAWSLWPIADEIAPEMTLTRGELTLIEAQLAPAQPARGKATQEAPAVEAAQEAPAVEAAQEAPAVEAAQEAPAVEAAQEAPAVEAAVPPPTLPDAPEVEARVPRRRLAYEPARFQEPPRPVVGDRPDRASGRETAAPEEPRVPAAANVAPPPPARGEQPPVARLLGRLAPHGDGKPQSPGPKRPSGRGQPAGDPWPHATAWSERPTQDHDWWIEGTPAEARPEAPRIETASPAIPATEYSLEPEAVPVTADQPTLFSAAPKIEEVPTELTPESVAWPKADTEVAEARQKAAPPQATPSAPPPADVAPTSRGPQEPAPWPPLGASWPAREAPGAPWPGPDAPPVPAAVVAQETSLQILAEMWTQSAQEVLNRGSVRVCHHCALPVSTHARYCRRCGTKQA
jgi:hypothetical protein